MLPFLSSPSLSATLFSSSWFLSPSWTEWSAMCRVSQQDHRKRQAPGWVLAAFRVEAKPPLYDEWPVKRRWQSDTHTTFSRRQAHRNLSALMYQNSSGSKSRNISGKVIQGCRYNRCSNNHATGIKQTSVLINLHFVDLSTTLNIKEIQSFVSVSLKDWN